MARTLTALPLIAALSFAGVSAASADTFSPSGAVTTFEGTVDFVPGTPLVCDFSLTITNNGSGDADVTSAVSSGGWWCSSLVFNNLPWNIDVVAPAFPPGAAATQLRIAGVQTNFPFACGPGDLIVNWDAGPAATITFPTGSTINPGGCGIAGVLQQTSGPALTITN
ncbi:hypothetical protein [Caulobacter mirabilis]|uniref:Protein activator of alkane oxidation PraB n=1 Tax=Caulobacter mirabilis TaxID=69666 RepID=A0A2D2AWD9_9CAUL|nr:hypothetical protein [Caulobacter mirabilis]ATQ42267.1 hypothetical protein CSW64_07465 [Caulobacter mirabilis]